MDADRSARSRVFVDTNVLFSASHSSQSAPGTLLQLHRNGHIAIVVSQQVLDELVRNLRDKLPSGIPVLQQLLGAIPPEIVQDPEQEDVDELTPIVNSDDAPILAAAINSGAHYLVTGDRTFLREARKAQTSLVVLTPREFLDQFELSDE